MITRQQAPSHLLPLTVFGDSKTLPLFSCSDTQKCTLPNVSTCQPRTPTQLILKSKFIYLCR